MSTAAATPTRMTDGEFAHAAALAERLAGMRFTPDKRPLLIARLAKHAVGRGGFGPYLDHVAAEPAAGQAFVEALATHLTRFLREPQHFALLRSVAADLPARARCWSAGCSTGEEAYSMAMMLLEGGGGGAGRDVRVLASDVSRPVLTRAAAGVYDRAAVKVPRHLLGRYFEPRAGGTVAAGRALRDLVDVRRVNLVGHWPFGGAMHVVFCRNVMIYLTDARRRELVGRFADVLAPGGLLFVGHAETLAGRGSGLTQVAPGVYRK